MEAAARQATVRKRVLIADDDADVCALLQVVLEPLCDLTVVHDAEAALRLIAEMPAYDAVVSDFMLPGLTGLEFVERVRRAECDERVRRSECDERVPILIISGHGSLGVGAAVRAAGADAFLDKPFTLAQLRAAVLALLAPQMRYAH